MSGVDVMRMKDVIISVTGVQQGVNGPDAMELVTAGQYGQDEKETLLTWQESELTGMEGTKTSLRVQPRGVVLSREGALNTRMEFEEGRKRYFLYETPFGSATIWNNTAPTDGRRRPGKRPDGATSFSVTTGIHSHTPIPTAWSSAIERDSNARPRPRGRSTRWWLPGRSRRYGCASATTI